jgi:hypothetical protein
VRRVKRIGLAVIALLTVAVLVGVPPRTGAATNTDGATAFFEFQSFFFGAANGCSAPNPGATPRLDAPVVALAVTPDDGGDWQAAADGGVFTCGDARFYGSTGNMHLNAPVVGMATTPDGHGYWLVAADGGVFNFGDAHFYGSAGNMRLNAPVGAMAATHDGHGYWLVAADGGVFSFGDARFHGSAATLRLNAPITGVAATPGGGYWLCGADAGVFAYGGAPFHGSGSGFGSWPDPIGGIAATRDGRRYVLFLTPPQIEPSTPGLSGFDLARRNYMGSYYYSAALRGLFLDQAAFYLQTGEQSHTGYSAAINGLEQLAAIPSMVTPAQAAQYARLTAELDVFFGTPGFGAERLRRRVADRFGGRLNYVPH